MTLQEVTAHLTAARADRRRYADELEQIHIRHRGESLPPGDQTRWDDISRAADKARSEIDRLEGLRDELLADRAERLELVRSSPFVESGDGATAGDRSFNVNARVNADPWTTRAGTFAADPLDDLHARAEVAIERSWFPDVADADATRNKVVELLAEHHEDGEMAAYLTTFSRPAYRSAFCKYVRDPLQGVAMFDAEERDAWGTANKYAMRAAMAESSTSVGGALVPVVLDPQIMLTNVGSMNPMRQIATVKTITTQTWKGVTSAGVTAEWAAEAAEAADASPTVANPTITPVRGDVYVQASFELLDDTDLANQIAQLVQDGKDNLEATAFWTGTGSTQPKGVITAISAVTASRVAGSSGAAGAADFVLADVYAVDNAVPYRWRKNGLSWGAEITTFNKIRRFGEGTTANAAFWQDLGGGVPPTLLSHPTYIASAMDNTIVSGSNDDVLLLGDFRQYYVVDRIGTRLVYNPLVLGASRRPTGEAAWFAWWRTGADVASTADAFRLLRL